MKYIVHLKFHLDKISFSTLKAVLQPFYLLNDFVYILYKILFQIYTDWLFFLKSSISWLLNSGYISEITRLMRLLPTTFKVRGTHDSLDLRSRHFFRCWPPVHLIPILNNPFWMLPIFDLLFFLFYYNTIYKEMTTLAKCVKLSLCKWYIFKLNIKRTCTSA